MLTDKSIMTFGQKWRGYKLIDIPASYFLFIYENVQFLPIDLKIYIESNMDALKQEAGNTYKKK